MVTFKVEKALEKKMGDYCSLYYKYTLSYIFEYVLTYTLEVSGLFLCMCVGV